jgi:hypothetical protein
VEKSGMLPLSFYVMLNFRIRDVKVPFDVEIESLGICEHSTHSK